MSMSCQGHLKQHAEEPSKTAVDRVIGDSVKKHSLSTAHSDHARDKCSTLLAGERPISCAGLSLADSDPELPGGFCRYRILLHDGFT